jgi:hypothetical protein
MRVCGYDVRFRGNRLDLVPVSEQKLPQTIALSTKLYKLCGRCPPKRFWVTKARHSSASPAKLALPKPIFGRQHSGQMMAWSTPI